MRFLFLLALLPNLTLTPGVTRPEIDQHVLCTTHWGLDRRHVTLAMRRQVLRDYKIPWGQRGAYELDHLIPRELGGADDVRNLWPQPWPDARIKDRMENAFHAAVCAGRIRLVDAQWQMRNWGRVTSP